MLGEEGDLTEYKARSGAELRVSAGGASAANFEQGGACRPQPEARRASGGFAHRASGLCGGPPAAGGHDFVFGGRRCHSLLILPSYEAHVMSDAIHVSYASMALVAWLPHAGELRPPQGCRAA
jgi:hypothetical protein